MPESQQPPVDLQALARLARELAESSDALHAGLTALREELEAKRKELADTDDYAGWHHCLGWVLTRLAATVRLED